jgi:hypothetical protein
LASTRSRSSSSPSPTATWPSRTASSASSTWRRSTSSGTRRSGWASRSASTSSPTTAGSTSPSSSPARTRLSTSRSRGVRPDRRPHCRACAAKFILPAT